MPKSFSRTAVDLFCECPRCFYLLHQKGLKRPPGYPFTLNAAVDKLAKEEFDTYRKAQTNHPIMPNTNTSPILHASNQFLHLALRTKWLPRIQYHLFLLHHRRQHPRRFQQHSPFPHPSGHLCLPNRLGPTNH